MRMAIATTAILLSLSAYVSAFPAYGSLAGLSEEEIEIFSRAANVVGAGPAPPANPNTTSYIVADAAHPYRPPGPTDIRGPCPGLNTLASHGVIHLRITLLLKTH